MANIVQLSFDFSDGAPIAKAVPMASEKAVAVESFDPETSLYFASPRDFREVANRQGITFRKGDPCAHCNYHGLCDCDGCAMLLHPVDMPSAPKMKFEDWLKRK